MAVKRIKRGDTKPLDAQLTDTRGVVVLTGATVKFAMKQREGTKYVQGAAIVTDADLGKVRYSWGLNDTNTAGIYDTEFEVTFPSGQKQTFPSDDYEELVILPDLAL